MALDPRIALGVQPMPDPMQAAGRAMQLKSLLTQQDMQAMQLADAQRQQKERQVIGDAFRGALGADGNIDRTRMLSSLATSGLGHHIPAYQKQFMETDKAATDIANTRGQIDERAFKMRRDQLGEVNKATAALLMRPAIEHRDVIDMVVGLVHQGIITPEMGGATVQQLPSHPAQLRQFLMQQAMRGVETAKALELMTPKYEKVDTGGEVRFVDTNAWTNPNPQALPKTMTPGEVATDARGRQANAIAAGNLAVSRDRLAWDKTRPPAGTFVDTSGGLVFGNPRDGTYRPATPVGMPGAAQPEAGQTAAPGVAAAPTRAADFGQPALGKPKVQLDAEVKTLEREKAMQNAASVAADALAVIDKAIAHPGRAISTGGTSLLMADRIPGTDAADFRAVRKQIEGKAFLQAFETLKGGGQITEIEGRKATEAIARLDVAQSDEEYLQALNDLRDVVARGYERATGQPYPVQRAAAAGAAAGAQRINNDAEFDALPSGAEFIGPDGKRRRKP